MSSSPPPHSSLDLAELSSTASVAVPATSRVEATAPTSVRDRNKTERTPRLLQNSQDVVHVAIRLKPPTSAGESRSLIQYSIDPGGLGSPRTGRQRESGVLGRTTATSCNNVVLEDTCNGGSSRHEEAFCASNNSSSIVSNLASARAPVGRINTHRVAHSPGSGVGGKILTLSCPTADNAMGAQHMYEFGDIFSPTMTDSQICNSVVPGVVEQLRAGFNACVLCYGQTGSGKTHMINALIPAFLHALFAQDAGENIVEMSYIQIHNNNAYNLLAEDRSHHGALLEKPRGSVVREPRCLVRNVADAKGRISDAQRRRFVGCHALNSRSSRSHVLLSLHVTRCIGGVPVTTNRLTLGDLAGSERVKRTGVAGDELEEAIAINKSLSVLHAVIRATTEDASVLPVRESILTLYLASSLANCYLLLIATVSLDKQSFPETKNSLDFATTAKRCVVRKAKAPPRDAVMSGVYSFEEVHSHLLQEIETLRHRVCTLQAEVNAEKQRSENLGVMDATTPIPLLPMTETEETMTRAIDESRTENELTTPTNHISTVMSVAGFLEIAKVRDHLLALERQSAVLQDILRDRERDVNSVESRGSLAEEVSREMERRVREQEQEQKQKQDKVQQASEEMLPVLEAREVLRKVTDAFMWIQEQLGSMSQQKQIMTRAMEAMRNEQQRTEVDLLEARKKLGQAEKRCEEVRHSMEELITENAKLKAQLEDLNLKLLCEYTERAIREETVAWFKASGERVEECERLTTAFKDQQNLSGVLQSRLTSTEQELDRSNKQQGLLLQEMRKKDEAFRTIWFLLTPQQKARFMSIGYGGDVANTSGTVSLHQGHENVLLRSQVRTLKKQLEEESLRSKDRDYRIEDLENENRLLLDRLRNREDEYNSLLSLDQDYRNEREQMEQQIAHLYTYIEEHNEKERLFERRLREAQAEWEKMDGEHRSAQRELVDLTMKLEKAMGEIRAQEADKDKLKDLLREVQQRDLLHMNLHHQLATKQRGSDDALRRVGMMERKQQHSAILDATAHNQHGDLIKPKATHRSPEIVRKGAMSRMDSAKFIRAVTHQPSAQQASRPRRLQYEVSQMLRKRATSSASFDGAVRMLQDANNSAHIHHNDCLRRQTVPRNGSNEVAVKSSFVRSHTSTAEAPDYIVDRTRRLNSKSWE